MFETLQKLQTDHIYKMEEFAKIVKGDVRQETLSLEKAMMEIEKE